MKTRDMSVLRDYQLKALDMLDCFVRLCEENHLTYYISGGTFLGAVRHGGFIPWDDDVDVAMPRKDYTEFLRIAESQLPERYSINHFSKKSDSIYYVPKIEDNQFRFVSTVARNTKTVNLWMDVFPLDGLPQNAFVRKIHCLHLLVLRGLYKLSLFDDLVDYRNKNRPWYENAIIWTAIYIPAWRIISPQKVMRRLDGVLSKYDYYESVDIMNFMGSYKFRSIMNREKIYAEGADYSFEGRMFRAPKQYDAYLKQIYGNYNELPPESKRNWHHTEIEV